MMWRRWSLWVIGTEVAPPLQESHRAMHDDDELENEVRREIAEEKNQNGGDEALTEPKEEDMAEVSCERACPLWKKKVPRL